MATCPPGYPVKSHTDSGIYRTPESPSYAQTIAGFCFATTSVAEAGVPGNLSPLGRIPSCWRLPFGAEAAAKAYSYVYPEE